MYLWELVGPDPAESPLRSGIGGDLAPIMRALEADLAKPLGLVGRVTEVVPRISVSHLGVVHVPTGREWLSRRGRRGRIRWESRRRPADPEAAYRLAKLRDLAAAG